MKTLKKQAQKNSKLIILIVFSILSVGLTKFNLFSKIDFRLYDFMLGITREAKTNNDIVLVDVDNDSLAKVGAWPWTRDILGNALIRMKEFGAKQAVFDIEYVSPSTSAVEENLEEKINENFASGQQAIYESITGFGSDISNGRIPLAKAQSESENLASDISNNVLYEMMRNITSDFNRDNDDYFARAVQFFGNASLTVNMRDIAIKTDSDEIEYIEDRFLFTNVVDKQGLIKKGNRNSEKEESGDVQPGFVPVIHKIATRANGVGFTNVVVDRDGTRRRVQILNEQNGKYAGQLSFAPLVKELDVQEIERTKNAYILRGLKFPNEENRRDIKIPVDKHGRMLINWLHCDFEKSFSHVPAFLLYNIDLAEKLVFENIAKAAQESYTGLSEEDAQYITENCAYAAEEYQEMEKHKNSLLLKCRGFNVEGQAIRGGLTDSDYSEYFNRRNEFFTGLNDFVDSLSEIDGLDSIEILSELKKSVKGYLKDFYFLRDTFKGAFCLIGNTASSSTDLGVTPFSKSYANLGTHANVANTILQQDFIVEKSPYWGILLSFVCAMAVILFSEKFSYGRQNLAGLLYIALPVAILFTSMTAFKVYVPMVNAMLLAVFIYVAETFLNFRLINREKKFLQTKMGAYVSPEVVKEMQKNPELAELGAQNRYMTALFSDVKTFSGFTETLNNALGEEQGAVALQKILSDYLGYLTKAIMGQKGTVDKFVGDEIVSFFNAPLDDEEHAFHSCVAGIRMLQAEAKYNEEFRDSLPINKQTGEPFLLHSRVGINTGYMAVGNMGTLEKMNYTVMGNAVNLASRLEGTNKVYGSWIMCSDSTWIAADSGENKGKLVARKFDCVRVINVKKPVQIHNILGLREELPEEQIRAAEIFNKGMEWYLKGSTTPDIPKDMGDFDRALELFRKAKETYPGDLSSDEFIRRCEKFKANGIDGPWDGVYTMESK